MVGMYDSKGAQSAADLDVLMGLPPNKRMQPTA